MLNVYSTFDFYQKRDLVYKSSINNLYLLPKISKVVITQPVEKKEELYIKISSFILLFESIPFFLQIEKTSDKKIKKTIIGVKKTLPFSLFFHFFFRLKSEENYNALFKQILQSRQGTFKINFNIFEEFLLLFEKFPVLGSLYISFVFKNCKTSEEEKLLLTNLLVS